MVRILLLVGPSGEAGVGWELLGAIHVLHVACASPAGPGAVVVLPPRCLDALCLLLRGGGVCPCHGQEAGEPLGCLGAPPAVGVG